MSDGLIMVHKEKNVKLGHQSFITIDFGKDLDNNLGAIDEKTSFSF